MATTTAPGNDDETVEHVSIPVLSLTPVVVDSNPELSVIEPPPSSIVESVSLRPNPLDSPRSDHPSTSSQTPAKKPTTFRRLQPKSPRSGQSTVHSRSTSSSSSLSFIPSTSPVTSEALVNPSAPSTLVHVPTKLNNEITSIPSPVPTPPSPLHAPKAEKTISQTSQKLSAPPTPSSDVISIKQTSSTSTSAHDAEISISLKSPQATSSLALSRKSAPYRPGFQPKGVYRPLTDEFLALRQSIHDGESDGGMKRVERTKLERRLEKLISLHFPLHNTAEHAKETIEHAVKPNPVIAGRNKSRISLFGSFKSLSIQDAGDFWKEVVSNGLGDQSKAEVRGRDSASACCSISQVLINI